MTLSMKTGLAAMLLGSVALTACQADEDVTPVEVNTPEIEVTSEAPEPETEAPLDTPGTIVTVASETDDLSTLVAAVKAAGLVETLNSDGPFTVFAPQNSAFDKLPDGTVENLLMPEQKETLSGILTYHVVSGEVMADDLLSAIEAEEDGIYDITTVNGAILSASVVDNQATLTDATGNTSTIVFTNVDATNGVVHLIDTVVMPE